MEQLSTFESVFIPYHVKATEFLAANSPSPEDFDTYHENQISKIYEGNDVWVVRNVETVGRVYDLMSGRRHTTLATIDWDGDAQGTNTYQCLVYGNSDEQAAFAQKMSEVRRWIASKGMSDRDTETIFLGMALTEIERIVAEK